MAFVDVELTDEEKAALGMKYVKFNAIGDKFLGKVTGTRQSTGSYAKPGDLDFVVKTKNTEGAVVEMLLTPGGDLGPKFRKAGVRAGFKLRIEYIADRDVGKESPMKVFKLQVDASEAVAAGAAPAAAPAAAKPAPKPAPAPTEDDIDF